MNIDLSYLSAEALQDLLRKNRVDCSRLDSAILDGRGTAETMRQASTCHIVIRAIEDELSKREAQR